MGLDWGRVMALTTQMLAQKRAAAEAERTKFGQEVALKKLDYGHDFDLEKLRGTNNLATANARGDSSLDAAFLKMGANTEGATLFDLLPPDRQAALAPDEVARYEGIKLTPASAQSAAINTAGRTDVANINAGARRDTNTMTTGAKVYDATMKAGYGADAASKAAAAYQNHTTPDMTQFGDSLNPNQLNKNDMTDVRRQDVSQKPGIAAAHNALLDAIARMKITSNEKVQGGHDATRRADAITLAHANLYGIKKRAESSEYGADKSYDASKYRADKSYDASIYSSDHRAAGAAKLSPAAKAASDSLTKRINDLNHQITTLKVKPLQYDTLTGKFIETQEERDGKIRALQHQVDAIFNQQQHLLKSNTPADPASVGSAIPSNLPPNFGKFDGAGSRSTLAPLSPMPSHRSTLNDRRDPKEPTRAYVDRQLRDSLQKVNRDRKKKRKPIISEIIK